MNKIKFVFVSTVLLSFLQFTSVLAQTDIFHSNPDWISTPDNDNSTGLGIADINRDGWDDIVIANGNDIGRQHLVVYYNNGDGTFPQTPSWSSADVDYHGHLATGDINGDGLPDVAVSVFLGAGGFSDPGHVKVYFNQGNGLEASPSYQTADNMFTFSCALGDPDGDGDLDLAVAGGQPYSIGAGPYQTEGRIYYNVNGALQTLPGWKSTPTMGALDVDFADMDLNGFPDILFAAHLTPNYIFMTDSAGNTSVQPGWSSQDQSYYGNSLTIANFGADNYPDLIVSDNSQLGGSGKFKGYFFNNSPAGQSIPDWNSQTGGFGSAVLAEDLTGDGFADLLGGRWWGNVILYQGTSGGLNISASWQSAVSSVVEAFVLRDLDQDGRMLQRDTLAVQNRNRGIFLLSNPTTESIENVFLNQQLVPPGNGYCSIPGGNWISFKDSLQAGDEIIVEYYRSMDRDLVVSNWDQQGGNHLYYNQTNPVRIGAPAIIPANYDMVQVYPNPFNQTCRFQVRISRPGPVEITIFDLHGRPIEKIRRRHLNPGTHQLSWDGKNNAGQDVGSGVYFYEFTSGKVMSAGKLIVVR